MSKYLYIGKSGSGKSTYLFNKICEYISNGKRIIILDSATEHKDKSLLMKTLKSFNGVKIVNCQDAEKVVNDDVDILENYQDYFPFDELSKSKAQVIGFDLAFFLERGYLIYETTRDLKKYQKTRSIYNNLSNQILTLILVMYIKGQINVDALFLDEIEFPIHKYKYPNTDLDVFASIHKENAFGTFYKTFDKTDEDFSWRNYEDKRE